MAVARIGIERHVADDADVGHAALMARTARQTRLSGLKASLACSSRSDVSV